jgi:hypothetical protein
VNETIATIAAEQLATGLEIAVKFSDDRDPGAWPGSVRFRVTPGALSVSATDTFTLVTRTMPADTAAMSDPVDWYVDAADLARMIPFLGRSGGRVAVAVGHGAAEFTADWFARDCVLAFPWPPKVDSVVNAWTAGTTVYPLALGPVTLPKLAWLAERSAAPVVLDLGSKPLSPVRFTVDDDIWGCTGQVMPVRMGAQQ